MASLEMAHRSASAWYAVLAWALLALLSVVVSWLAWLTLRAAVRGSLPDLNEPALGTVTNSRGTSVFPAARTAT